MLTGRLPLAVVARGGVLLFGSCLRGGLPIHASNSAAACRRFAASTAGGSPAMGVVDSSPRRQLRADDDDDDIVEDTVTPSHGSIKDGGGNTGLDDLSHGSKPHQMLFRDLAADADTGGDGAVVVPLVSASHPGRSAFAAVISLTLPAGVASSPPLDTSSGARGSKDARIHPLSSMDRQKHQDDADDALQKAATMAASLELGGMEGCVFGGRRLAVSDDLDIEGAMSHAGLASPMFHSVASKDETFVGWLRRRGCQIVGKLRCTSPFAYADAASFLDCPGAVAVDTGACDVAIVTSLVGPPGIVAPLCRPSIGFLPSATSLPPSETQPYSQSIRGRGWICKSLDQLDDFWDGVSVSHDLVRLGSGGMPSSPAAVSRRREEQRHIDRVMRSREERRIVLGVPTKFLDRLVDQPGAGEAFRLALELVTAKLNDAHHRSLLELGAPPAEVDEHPRHRASTSSSNRSLDADDDMIFDERRTSKTTSRARKRTARNAAVRTLRHVLSPATAVAARFRRIEAPPPVDVRVVDVDFDWKDSDIISCVTNAAKYEMAHSASLQRLFSDSLGGGLLEELPVETVADLHAGRGLASEVLAHHRALVDRLRLDWVQETLEVDYVVIPIVSSPYQSGNLRSVMGPLSFSLLGTPMVSFRLPLLFGNVPMAQQAALSRAMVANVKRRVQRRVRDSMWGMQATVAARHDVHGGRRRAHRGGQSLTDAEEDPRRLEDAIRRVRARCILDEHYTDGYLRAMQSHSLQPWIGAASASQATRDSAGVAGGSHAAALSEPPTAGGGFGSHSDDSPQPGSWIGVAVIGEIGHDSLLIDDVNMLFEY